MKFNTIFTLVASAAVAQAHSTITNILVNDVDQGVGDSASGYIRSPPNNNPVKDITSADLTCNVNNVATTKTIDVTGGDKITFQWHHNTVDASDDIIDPSHKGPVLVYIAPTSSNGAGDVWVKLAESGYDSATQTWAVTTLISNKGQHSITLPDLAAGTYLLRPEIIALHEADAAYNVNPARGAQFYMECVQIRVTSSGAKTLPAGVAIPGTYKYSDPGVVFNLYGSFTSYTIPGPAVWDGASGSSPVSSKAATATPVTTTAVATTAVVVPTTSAVAVEPTTSAIAVEPTTSAAVPVATTTEPSVVTTSAPTTLITLTKPATTASATPSSPATTGTVALYYQCGGKLYTGATECVAGAVCKVQNPYYSQCVAA